MVIFFVSALSLIGLLSARLAWRRLGSGSPIVYRVVETSADPLGNGRCCVIHRYWRVKETLADGWIVALTPRMEYQYLRRDDPNLRKAGLLERHRYATRFPSLA